MSSYSHLAGVVLSIIGVGMLLAYSHGNPWRVVGFSIYGTSLILLYLASTAYHWLELSPQGEDLLKRFDHVAIFALIAGTYTPVCLVPLRGGWGWSIFAVVWSLALAGAVMKLFFEHLPRWASTAAYLAMGWIAVIAVGPLVRSLPGAGLMWLLTGGILYSLGALVYATKRPDPFADVFGFHEIFHFLVLGGSISHFVFMARYILPA